MRIKQESSPARSPGSTRSMDANDQPRESSLLIDLSQDDSSDERENNNNDSMMIDLSNDDHGKSDETTTIDLTQDEEDPPQNPLLRNNLENSPSNYSVEDGVMTIDLTQDDDDENDSSPSYERKVSLTEEESSTSNPLIKDEPPASPARNLFSMVTTHSTPRSSPTRNVTTSNTLSQSSIPPEMDNIFQTVTKESPLSPKRKTEVDANSPRSVENDQNSLESKMKPPPFSPLIAKLSDNPEADSSTSIDFPLPVRGSLCRVLCKTDGSFFSNLRKEIKDDAGPEKGWYPGQVEKVTWKQAGTFAEIKVRFFDETDVTVDYHHPPTKTSTMTDASDFQVLLGLPENPLAFRTAWSDSVCYTRDPSTASVGDLVQAWYQNNEGQKWFSGRIVHIRSTKKGAVCDIVYEDGDFESGVPLESKYVHLLEKGREQPEWLIGLPFSRGRGRKKLTGVVSDAESRGPIKITYKGKGGSTTETRAYTAVVHTVMMMAVQQVQKGRQYIFPDLEETSKSEESDCVESTEARSTAVQPPSEATSMENVEPMPNATPASMPLLPKADPVNTAEESGKPKRGKKRPPRARKQPEALPAVDEGEALEDEIASTMPRKTRPVRARKQRVALSLEDEEDSDSAYSSDEDFEDSASKPKKRAKSTVKKEKAASSGKENNETKLTTKRTAQRATAKPKGRSSSALSSKGDDEKVKPKRRGKNKIPSTDESCTISKKARFASIQWYEADDIQGADLQDGSSKPRKELPPALGKVLCKGLHSCDTHLAADMLTFVTTNHNLEPNSDVIRSLVELFLQGPMFGKANFPDCQRMEIAQNFMCSATTHNPQLLGRFVETAGPAFWSRCLESLESMHYAVDGDESRATTFAVDRIAQSVHLKACCADFFLKLLDHQMNVSWGKSEALDRDTILSQLMIADMASHRRGTKEAFEGFVKQWISHWDILGKYNASLSDVYPDQSEISRNSLHFLQEQSHALLKTLAAIVSRISWLHKVAEEESDSAVAYSLSNLISRNSTFDGEDAKLRLVLALDNRIVPEMRICLAEKLGVGERFDMLFSLLA